MNDEGGGSSHLNNPYLHNWHKIAFAIAEIAAKFAFCSPCPVTMGQGAGG